MADGPEFAALPLDAKRGLRCCLRCNLVKTFEQFVDDGCDNCPVLGMKDDQERVADCTSRYVRVRPPPRRGYQRCELLALEDPHASWRVGVCRLSGGRLVGIGTHPRVISGARRRSRRS